MRRITILALGAALLTATAVVVHGAAAGSTGTAAAAAPAAASPGVPTGERAMERGLRTTRPPSLATQLARARLATAKYATNLATAKADGYQILTRDIPDMGWHFLNPQIQHFQITNPPILVYQHHQYTWQLAALEWTFTHQPTTPPLPGATYGSFPAACHYTDGSFLAARAQELCPKHSPQTGARFTFWHPDLVTLHLWLWYPNPAGLYNSTNPLVHPFNHS
jgi:hypothetical protein